MAEKVSDSIDVEASAQEIFDVAIDFESYPEWSASIKNVDVKETDSEGRPTMVWFEVDAKLRVVRYTLAYDYSNAPESFSWHLLDGDVKELSGSYVFDDFGDVTEVRYELTLDPGFPVPRLLRRQGERQIVRGALEDLKKRVETS